MTYILNILIFHAGVVLSCIAILLPPTIHPNQGTCLHLDQLASGDEILTKQVADWINTGGDFQLSLFGVPSLCSAAGRQDVLDQTAGLLKRRKVWGMARNLTKVVLSLATRDADAHTDDAAESLHLFSTSLSCESFPVGV
jgi:hypothetical protein